MKLRLGDGIWVAVVTPASPPNPIAARKSRHLRRWALGLVILVVILAVCLISRSRSSQVTWLNPRIFLSPSSKLWEQFRSTVIRFVPASAIQRWRDHRPRVRISLHLLRAPTKAEAPFNLPAPLFTNAAGLRAWSLSRENFADFNQQVKNQTFKTHSDVVELRTALSENYSGNRTIFEMTTNVGFGTNQIPVGLVVNFQPKASSGAVQLTTGITLTECTGLSASANPILETNLAVAFRALIPDGGALVVNTREGKTIGHDNYWLIINPMLVSPVHHSVKP